MMSKIQTNGDACSYLIRIEILWEKGEIACYKQFLLFPQCFQKLLLMHQNEYLWSKGLINLETLVGLISELKISPDIVCAVRIELF